MPASSNEQSVKLFFSDEFNIRPAVVKKHGALDVSFLADLPLFIDPFLLFNSRKPAYKNLHGEMIRYLGFLRDKAAGSEFDRGLAGAWYTFPEVKQTWLGFTKRGNRGRGLGMRFARALHDNLGKLFSDFGSEQLTKGSHLEKLCLIEEGVGRDNISDFTTNLIKGYLLSFTQEFARKHLENSQKRRISVPKVTFNYKTESWESRTFTLPYINRDFVLLTPRDLLTRDDVWINKRDLIEDFEQLPLALPNLQLRAEINNYFRSILPRRARKEDRHTAAAKTILKFPVLIDAYIRNKEDSADKASSLSRDKVRVSEQLFLTQIRELAQKLALQTDFYQTANDTCVESRQRAHFLKDVVENKGGHKLFYVDGEPVSREADLHVAYRLTWFGTLSDVTREANDGRGSADFKISKGARDKTLVEFKLASNSLLRKNLSKQTQIYQKASDAHCVIKVIMFFTAKEEKKVKRIPRELGMTESDENIVLIDARKDNKPSGSKAA